MPRRTVACPYGFRHPRPTGETINEWIHLTMAGTYTCADYRLEMILLGLTRRLESEALTDDEREAVRGEIRRIEAQLGIA